MYACHNDDEKCTEITARKTQKEETQKRNKTSSSAYSVYAKNKKVLQEKKRENLQIISFLIHKEIGFPNTRNAYYYRT